MSTKRFESAIDISKQIMTLSAGLVGISVAFLGRIATNSDISFYALVVSWVLWLVAIGLGIAAMGAFVSNISTAETSEQEVSIFTSMGKSLLRWQQVAFGLGVVVFVVAAVLDRTM